MNQEDLVESDQEETAFRVCRRYGVSSAHMNGVIVSLPRYRYFLNNTTQLPHLDTRNSKLFSFGIIDSRFNSRDYRLNRINI